MRCGRKEREHAPAAQRTVPFIRRVLTRSGSSETTSTPAAAVAAEARTTDAMIPRASDIAGGGAQGTRSTESQRQLHLANARMAHAARLHSFARTGRSIVVRRPRLSVDPRALLPACADP